VAHEPKSRASSTVLGDLLIRARVQRRWIAYVGYAVASICSLLLAFGLRFDLQVPDENREVIAWLGIALVAVRLLLVTGLRLTTARWRFVGVDDLARLFLVATISSLAVLGLFRGVFQVRGVPVSVMGMEWALFILGVAGTWLLYRWLYERIRSRFRPGSAGEKRVFIVGAGEAGHRLMGELLTFPGRYRVVGFLDDDPLKRGTRIQGVEVLGATDQAVDLLRDFAVDEFLLAIPSATPADLRGILLRLEPLRLPIRVFPGIRSVLEGTISLSQLRSLRIEDLLGREPVSLEIQELERELRGETVLVTGGAGSIGSELARQVAANRPERLILLDQAESALYFVDIELRRKHPDLDIVPVVADVLEEARMREVFETHRPGRIYHAAAYKHVPLMEQNPREAVRNNIVGTWQVARMAGEFGVKSFVLISTDKAADPVSVMGATKRAAEVVVHELQARFPETRCVAVRFGNVLGSNGSVIPLFRKQIQEGGPITITDPEVTRYFMTIPEAVHLVLRAGLLPEASGRVVMLEMGEPVKIVDLARNLVRLSGLRPEVDIEFRYTGLRPGEKLTESLNGTKEVWKPTSLSSVAILQTEVLEGEAGLLDTLERFDWKRAVTQADCQQWLDRFVRGLMHQSEEAPPVLDRTHEVVGDVHRVEGAR
jgi:FlaA1/EpsC-like NDP-sugar epimerase